MRATWKITKIEAKEKQGKCNIWETMDIIPSLIMSIDSRTESWMVSNVSITRSEVMESHEHSLNG